MRSVSKIVEAALLQLAVEELKDFDWGSYGGELEEVVITAKKSFLQKLKALAKPFINMGKYYYLVKPIGNVPNGAFDFF